MNVLFEEDGAFKAGAVLADNNTSLQVELASGKRSKVKAANVLLRFEAPAPAELLDRAERDAADIIRKAAIVTQNLLNNVAICMF